MPRPIPVRSPLRRRLRFVAFLPACTATALSVAGCGSGPVLSGDSRWPYAPASIRVHPLTHVALPRINAPLAGAPPAAGSGMLLEVYVEFQDRDGFETRGIGQLDVTLSARGDASLPSLHWSLDLRQPETNRTYFDWVTRTYRLPLVLEWPTQPRGGVAFIEVALTLEGSGTLRSSSEVSWPAR